MKSLMKMIPAILVVLFGVAGMSCTQRSPNGVVVPGNGAVTPPGGKNDPLIVTGEGGEFRAVLTRQEIEALGFKDFAGMTYRLTFLDQNRTGQVAMSGQSGSETGSIVEKSLPAGRSGKLVLELSENGVVKARGEKDGVTLVIGQPNHVALTMARVGDPTTPVTGNTSDLSIDIAIDTGSVTTNPQPPTNPTTTPGTPDLSQLGNWDGRSHMGNDRWTIETVR